MAKDYFQSYEFNRLLTFYKQQKDEKRKRIYLDAEEFADIADYYLSVDLPISAMEAVDIGLSIHPDSDILLIMKSSINIFQFQFKEAEAILADLDEDDPDVMYQLAQLQYAYHHNIPKAEELWRRWLKMENESEDEEYKRENYIHIMSTISVLYNPTDVSDNRQMVAKIARRWVHEYIETFQPLGKYDCDVQLIDICRENDLPDLMSEVLTQVLEEQPYLPQGWSTLALSRYVQKEYEQALEACAFALAINPDDIEALLTKAYTLYDIDDKHGARFVFKEYIDKGGELVQILPYAEILFSEGEIEEAKSQLLFLTKHLENDKKRQEDKKLKISKDSIEEYQEADAAYESFMELYKKIMADVGGIYYRNECYRRSLSIYSALIEDGCNSSEEYFMLGLNHLAMKQVDKALGAFEQSLSNAEDKVMRGIDIAIVFAMNNYDEYALEMFKVVDVFAARGNCPSVKNIAAAKSLTYLKLGDIEQFLPFFKIACKDTPELIQKVYSNYFPDGLPVSEWYDYAKREIKTLLKKISKEGAHIVGF